MTAADRQGRFMGTLFVNGKNVATGPDRSYTKCCGFSADEGADVGAA